MNDVLPIPASHGRTRVPYPAALEVQRYDYRQWQVDLVMYELCYWVPILYGPGVDGRRLKSERETKQALIECRRSIDQLIVAMVRDPALALPKRKVRGTKRALRKKPGVDE